MSHVYRYSTGISVYMYSIRTYCTHGTRPHQRAESRGVRRDPFGATPSYMDAYGLPIEQNTGGISAPLLEKMEKSREARRRLYGKLCRLGIFLRLLTVLNGLALVGGAAYSFYEYGLDEASTTSTPMETRVRLVIEYLLMAGSGFFLVLHEQGATTDEAGTRSSLGMAFSSGGRLLLFVILALISAPAVHTTRSFIELVATAGPVGALLANALLQSWLISCAPEYRS